MNRSIGLGSFSEVKLVMHKQVGTMVAVKIIRKEMGKNIKIGNDN